MNHNEFIKGLGLVLLAGGMFSSCTGPEREKLPNIVLILADDMGYGDPACYNEQSKVPTPNIDKMADQGVLFTDFHTASAVCTPTRYGIVTGRYSWRSELKKGVTWSYSPPLIEKDRPTVASELKKQGYYTSCIGKWHLGLGWTMIGDSADFSKPITGGPTALGFDYFYGITASLDIPPYVYIENDKVVTEPDTVSEGTSSGYEGAYWRRGPVAPDFDHFKTLDHLADKAIDQINQASQGTKPFFLYLALTAPHLPWIPSDEFKGKSGAGDYGDLAAQVDDVAGRILETLDKLGLSENTLVVFTSDNGSHWVSEKQKEFGHKANYIWKGQKGDIYEGGHRVPMIVKWPGKIAEGSTNPSLVSSTDFAATFLDAAGDREHNQRFPDSKSFLPVLTKEKNPDKRESMVYQSSEGMLGMRDGSYVYINGSGAGGFLEQSLFTEDDPFQLYDLSTDRRETHNLFNEDVGKLRALKNKLLSVKENEPNVLPE